MCDLESGSALRSSTLHQNFLSTGQDTLFQLFLFSTRTCMSVCAPEGGEGICGGVFYTDIQLYSLF